MGSVPLWPLMRARLFAIPSPIAVGFEITHRCNLRCVYCDRNSTSAQEMSLEECLKALADLRHLGMRAMSLDGGEPLVYPHIDRVVDWLHDHGVVLRMNTNGVLIGRHVASIRKVSKV